MDQVEAHASSAHQGAVTQDAVKHLKFASLIKIRHEAVIRRELKLALHVVVIEHNTLVLFEFVFLGDKVLGFITKEVDDKRSAVC